MDAEGVMTTTFRNRFFLAGILFGSLFGLLTGSLVAFQVGSNRQAMQQIIVRRWRRRQPIPYNNIRV